MQNYMPMVLLRTKGVHIMADKDEQGRNAAGDALQSRYLPLPGIRTQTTSPVLPPPDMAILRIVAGGLSPSCN
jgi:hypothetical protein